jgi:hypothetical protein
MMPIDPNLPEVYPPLGDLPKCDRCKKSVAGSKAKIVWGHLLCPDCAIVAERGIDNLISKLALPDDEFEAWVDEECTPPGDLPDWAA